MSLKDIQKKEKFLLIGNPGSGKSTLINCAVGKAVFKSGLCYGKGYTEFFQCHEHEDKVYMDTPGLADTQMMEQAAGEIKKALTQSGRYHLFFFVRLINGRVDKDDINTIQRVLTAIKMDKATILYSIVVNMVKKKQYAKLMEGGDEFKAVVACLNTSGFDTGSIVFVPEIPDLDEEDDACVRLPPSVAAFITNSPYIEIAPAVVSDINIDMEAIQKQIEMLEAVMTEMRKDRKAMMKRYEQLERQAIRMEEENARHLKLYSEQSQRWEEQTKEERQFRAQLMEKDNKKWDLMQQQMARSNQEEGCTIL